MSPVTIHLLSHKHMTVVIEELYQCCLRSVLLCQAMGIESEEDVYKLADFFMNYRHTQGEQTQVRREGGKKADVSSHDYQLHTDVL